MWVIIFAVWIVVGIYQEIDCRFWNRRGFFGWLSDRLLMESLRAEAEQVKKLREQREQIAEAEKIWEE